MTTEYTRSGQPDGECLLALASEIEQKQITRHKLVVEGALHVPCYYFNKLTSLPACLSVRPGNRGGKRNDISKNAQLPTRESALEAVPDPSPRSPRSCREKKAP